MNPKRSTVFRSELVQVHHSVWRLFLLLFWFCNSCEFCNSLAPHSAEEPRPDFERECIFRTLRPYRRPASGHPFSYLPLRSGTGSSSCFRSMQILSAQLRKQINSEATCRFLFLENMHKKNVSDLMQSAFRGAPSFAFGSHQKKYISAICEMQALPRFACGAENARKKCEENGEML